MIEQFYLDLYPVLTQDWRKLSQGFGKINYDLDVATSDSNLSARMYIHVGNGWANVGIEVRHRLHGTASAVLCDAKQPAADVLLLASNALPGLEAKVIQQYDAWADELDRRAYTIEIDGISAATYTAPAALTATDIATGVANATKGDR